MNEFKNVYIIKDNVSMMKLGILFSGGKDSTLATYLAKEKGHEISCLISIFSENKESYMFHVPSISKSKQQSKVMGIPIIVQKTKGEKESELKDLEKAIKKAKKDFNIEGIVTGAVESVYQSSRIQKICDKLRLDCFNPLWQKPQFEILEDLLKNKFEVIVTGVFAYPLTKKWLGKKIDKEFIMEMRKLNKDFKISPAGEGGEFETLVLNCPLFIEPLKIIDSKIFGRGYSWTMEVEVE
jgi:asparagine synthase (glutamine-hydrolysing)|tara:strand:- start:3450 stop:4166 length:717 start_codon:yes stop_codon:yes gene_type:complete